MGCGRPILADERVIRTRDGVYWIRWACPYGHLHREKIGPKGLAGIDILTIKELMGHKTLAMTLRYAHLSPNHVGRAVDVLSRRATDTATSTNGNGPRQLAEGRARQTPMEAKVLVVRPAGIEPATYGFEVRTELKPEGP